MLEILDDSHDMWMGEIVFLYMFACPRFLPHVDGWGCVSMYVCLPTGPLSSNKPCRHPWRTINRPTIPRVTSRRPTNLWWQPPPATSPRPPVLAGIRPRGNTPTSRRPSPLRVATPPPRGGRGTPPARGGRWGNHPARGVRAGIRPTRAHCIRTALHSKAHSRLRPFPWRPIARSQDPTNHRWRLIAVSRELGPYQSLSNLAYQSQTGSSSSYQT